MLNLLFQDDVGALRGKRTDRKEGRKEGRKERGDV